MRLRHFLSPLYCTSKYLAHPLGCVVGLDASEAAPLSPPCLLSAKKTKPNLLLQFIPSQKLVTPFFQVVRPKSLGIILDIISNPLGNLVSSTFKIYPECGCFLPLPLLSQWSVPLSSLPGLSPCEIYLKLNGNGRY